MCFEEFYSSLNSSERVENETPVNYGYTINWLWDKNTELDRLNFKCVIIKFKTLY